MNHLYDKRKLFALLWITMKACQHHLLWVALCLHELLKNQFRSSLWFLWLSIKEKDSRICFHLEFRILDVCAEIKLCQPSQGLKLKAAVLLKSAYNRFNRYRVKFLDHYTTSHGWHDRRERVQFGGCLVSVTFIWSLNYRKRNLENISPSSIWYLLDARLPFPTEIKLCILRWGFLLKGTPRLTD